MADSPFRAGGLASGLDTNLIIDKLIELESTPMNLLKQRQAAFQTQISRLADIKSKLSDLTTATKSLATGGAVATTVSGTQTGFDASPGTGATAGRHTVRVTGLATAAAARSQGFSSSSAPVMGGTLALNVQGTAYNINITDGSGLSDIAFQIRQSGAPVSATVVSDGTKYYLSIINNQTGFPISGTTADALSANETSTGSLGQPLTAPATPLVVQNATNASLTVDGLPITRQSNSVGDVIPGVTLNLKTLTATAESLVINNSTDGTKANLNKFIAAYNSAVSMVQGQLVSTPGSDRSSTLAGDPTMRSLQSSLQSLITTQVGTSSVRTLADLGVKTGRDGQLSLDDATLTKALDRDANAVNDLFAKATTGLGAVTESTVNRYANFVNGLLTARSKGLQDNVSRMDTQLTSMASRLDSRRTELVNQFTAMEKVVSQLKSTGNFLNQIGSGSSSK